MLISPADVGTAAWSRLLGDGMIQPLARGCALPSDLSPEPALRAAAVAWLVPARTAVTGLCALWVHGALDGPRPMPFTVAAQRGRHPDAPVGVPASAWTWHTDGIAWAAATRIAGVNVASPAHAIATALRVDDLASALPAAARALQEGLCGPQDVQNAIAEGSVAHAGRARQASAWRALRDALAQAPAQ